VESRGWAELGLWAIAGRRVNRACARRTDIRVWAAVDGGNSYAVTLTGSG
jgi:hypothetical protein